MGNLAQSGLARAQSNTDKAKNMTVTGCLVQGNQADQFTITDNGKTHDLKSSTMNLKDHVGHKVTVTGKVAPEDASKAGTTGGKTPETRLDITKLTMVSTTCP
jgi:hypothetical protein